MNINLTIYSHSASPRFIPTPNPICEAVYHFTVQRPLGHPWGYGVGLLAEDAKLR